MANYYVTLDMGDGRITRAFTYNATSKVLVPVDDRVDFEQGSDYFAITVNGDYPLLFDSDGLIVGDVFESQTPKAPRLQFIRQSCGVRHVMATLSQDGSLATKAVTESDTLPTGDLILLDNVAISLSGVTTTKVNEVWFLSDSGNYVVSDGQFIKVNP